MKGGLLLCCFLAACGGDAREHRATPPSPSTSAARVPQPVATPSPAAAHRAEPLAPAEPAPSAVAAPLESPEPPPAESVPPPGSKPPPCALESIAKVTRRGALFHVSALLRNLTSEPLEVNLPDPCPRGPAEFSGLPSGYDYYGVCAAGACPAPRPPLHLSFAPGQSREVTSIDIDPKQTSCTPPLPPAQYLLGFSVKTTVAVCSGAPGKIEIKAPPPPPAKPKAQCPPKPACGIFCPGGRFAHDENGCALCRCECNNPCCNPRIPCF